MKKNYIIVIEGPDGGGKGTIISMLNDYLTEKGINFISTREPGGTVISEKLREIILDVKNEEMEDITEAYLYATSRVQHVWEKLLPAYNEGKLVICDRFALSSICYQGHGRGFDVDMIKDLNKYSLKEMQDKMINIVLMVDAEEGIRRKKGQRELDRLELAGRDFHNRVNAGYALELEKNEYGNYYRVDANKSPEEVFKSVLGLLSEKGVI